MSKFFSRRQRNAALITLAVLLIPVSAWAWLETSFKNWTVKTGSGCIRQMQSVTHSGSNTTNLTVSTTAQCVGVSGGTPCKVSTPGTKSIRGSVGMLLYKLTKLRSGSEPFDQAFICDTTQGQSGWTTGTISASEQYNAPPCGTGYYALVSCIMQADTYIQGLPGGVKIGSFTATDAAKDCMVSPLWHPVMAGDPLNTPTVKLF